MTRIAQYLKSLLLLELLAGLGVTLRHLFKPKVTVQFPEE